MRRATVFAVSVAILVAMLNGVPGVIVNLAQHGYANWLINHDIGRNDSSSGAIINIKGFDPSPFEKLLRLGLRLDRSNFRANWLNGRLGLMTGNPSDAAVVLGAFRENAGDNVFFYMDLLSAYSEAGYSSDVAALWQQVGHLPKATAFFSDTVALSYLDLVDTTSPDIVRLKDAVDLRPDDFFASYWLWVDAIRGSQVANVAIYYDRLERNSFSSIEPGNPKLLKFVALTIPRLLQDEVWNREKVETLLSYYLWNSSNLEKALPVFEHLQNEFPEDAGWAYYMGEYQRRNGDLSSAVVNYRRSVELDAYGSLPHLRLAQLFLMSCTDLQTVCVNQSLKEYAILRELVPDDMVGQAEYLLQFESRARDTSFEQTLDVLWATWQEKSIELGPDILLSQKIGEGLLLEGYSIHEQRLVRGEPGTVVLFWQVQKAIDGEVQHDPNWRQISSDLWVQIVPGVQNMVIDGGFELGLRREMPNSFPEDIYRSPAETHDLQPFSQDGFDSTVAVLSNSATYTKTSFVTDYLPVEDGHLYLQSGWMASEGGNSFMGRRWRADVDDVSSLYSNITAGNKNPEWRRYVQVISAPVAGTTDVQVRLQNFNSAGRVLFDEILLLPLGSVPFSKE